jgi:hypothetical protein
MNKERLPMVWSKVMILKNRAMGYYGVISTLMILRVYLETFENQVLGLGLFVVAMIGIGIITLFDFKYIYGRESEILWGKNRTTNEMAKRIERIENKLDTLRKYNKR